MSWSARYATRLLSGLIDAPSCSDCHGGHRIYEVDNKRAPGTHANAPEMCGECHTLLLDEWKDLSAHGLAWQDDDETAPVCTDCHGKHRIEPPEEEEQ